MNLTVVIRFSRTAANLFAVFPKVEHVAIAT